MRKLISMLFIFLIIVSISATTKAADTSSNTQGNSVCILNCEFDTIPGTGSYCLPTAMVKDGKTAALFDSSASNSRIGFMFDESSNEYRTLYEAFSNSAVKIETSFYTEGDNTIRNFFNGLLRVRNSELQMFQGNNILVAPFADGQWHTVSVTVKYTKSGFEAYDIIADGTKLNLSIVNAEVFSDVNALLSNFIITQPHYSNKLSKMYVDYLRIYKLADNTSYFTKEDGTKTKNLNEAAYLNIPSASVETGTLTVMAYYSENALIKADSFIITSADTTDDVVSRAVEPEGAKELKVFVFKNQESLAPTGISPIGITAE